jgi:hypothetical protein
MSTSPRCSKPPLLPDDEFSAVQELAVLQAVDRTVRSQAVGDT